MATYMIEYMCCILLIENINISSPQEEDCILWTRKVVMEKPLDNLGFLDLNPNTNHASVSQRSIPATPLTLNVKRMERRLDMIYNIENKL